MVSVKSKISSYHLICFLSPNKQYVEAVFIIIHFFIPMSSSKCQKLHFSGYNLACKNNPYAQFTVHISCRKFDAEYFLWRQKVFMRLQADDYYLTCNMEYKPGLNGMLLYHWLRQRLKVEFYKGKVYAICVTVNYLSYEVNDS